MPIQAENIVSVTSENLAAFAAEKLGLAKPEDAPKDEPKAEVKDEPKDGDDKHDEPPKKKGNAKIENRFSELTEKRRAAEERAERAERELAEFKAKAEPKKEDRDPDDIGEKPKQADFTDAFEYAEKLAEWTAKKTLKDRDEADAKAKQEAKTKKVIDAWSKRLEQAKADLPDFDDLMASSKAAVSDPARDAIIESEWGPQIAYALASDDELAEKVTDMKPADQLKWIGRQEDKFERMAEKDKPPEEKPKEEVKERKAAPAPIVPVKGGKTPDNPVNTPGDFKGSYQEWKAARMAQMQR